MTTGFCEHCDLPYAQCYHSLPGEVLNPSFGGGAQQRTGKPILARLTSPCAGCGDTMEEGVDQIAPTDHGWMHLDCTLAPDTPPETPVDLFENF